MAEGDGPIDPGQRRIAERRLLTALRRHQRRSPLRPDLRVDTLVAEMRAGEPAHGRGHRGRQPVILADADLRQLIEEMVATGALLRRGHRVRLPDSGAGLDPVMRGRMDELMATLRSGGASPPPVEGVAARLGIPAALIDQLRDSGGLVTVGPRIEYPLETWDEITRQLDQLAAGRTLSVGLVRDELGTSRRHAEAILRHRARGRA
jgi:hypothetical protein